MSMFDEEKEVSFWYFGYYKKVVPISIAFKEEVGYELYAYDLIAGYSCWFLMRYITHWQEKFSRVAPK
jgi:hypothetical protein